MSRRALTHEEIERELAALNPSDPQAEARAALTDSESEKRSKTEIEMQDAFNAMTTLAETEKTQLAKQAAQKVQAFTPTAKRKIPLQLGVLIDTSGSMRGSANTVKTATENFCTALKKHGFNDVDATIVPFSELTVSQNQNRKFQGDLDQLPDEFYKLLESPCGCTNFQAGAQVLLEKMLGVDFSQKKPLVTDRVNTWVNTRVPDYRFVAVNDLLSPSSPERNTFYIKFDSATQDLQYVLQTETEVIRGILPNNFYSENFGGKTIDEINTFISINKKLQEELLSYARTQGYIPLAPAFLILTDGEANKAVVDGERADTQAGLNTLFSHSKISQVHFIAYGDDAQGALTVLSSTTNPNGGFSALKDEKVKFRLAQKTQDARYSFPAGGPMVGGLGMVGASRPAGAGAPRSAPPWGGPAYAGSPYVGASQFSGPSNPPMSYGGAYTGSPYSGLSNPPMSYGPPYGYPPLSGSCGSNQAVGSASPASTSGGAYYGSVGSAPQCVGAAPRLPSCGGTVGSARLCGAVGSARSSGLVGGASRMFSEPPVAPQPPAQSGNSLDKTFEAIADDFIAKPRK